MADPISIFAIAAGSMALAEVIKPSEKMCDVPRTGTGANTEWLEYAPCSELEKVDEKNPTLIGKDLKV